MITGRTPLQTHRGPHRQEVSAAPWKAPSGLPVPFERVADQLEHRWPESDEQRTAFCIAAFVLIDRLGADPKSGAEDDRRKRRRMAVPAAETSLVQSLRQHGRSLSVRSFAKHGFFRVCP